MEFSEYIETRTPADVLTGTEIFVVSQDGGSVRMTAIEFAAYIAAVIGPAASNAFRGGWDLSGNTPPSATGSGSGGSNIAGDTWYLTDAGEVDPGEGDGPQFYPINTLVIAKIDGATSSTDFIWRP